MNSPIFRLLAGALMCFFMWMALGSFGSVYTGDTSTLVPALRSILPGLILVVAFGWLAFHKKID